MQRNALNINNVKYSSYLDSDNFLYPAEGIKEKIILRTSLVNNATKNLNFSFLTSPVFLQDLYFFSSNTTANKTITLTQKDENNNSVWRFVFPINNTSIIVLPKIIFYPQYSLEMLANATVESLSLIFERTEILNYQSQ